jgi:hypothetical protein
MFNTIVIPGIGGSGDAHWQTHWQREHPDLRRIAPASWDAPRLDDWMAALDHAVRLSQSPPLLVAHSLGCLLIAHWARTARTPVAGAFLVAVPDPDRPAFPDAAADFVDVPETRLGFPALIIASTNDPYADPDYAYRRGTQWGAAVIEAGPAGHINGSSGLGVWPQGWDLFTAFAAGAGFPRR